MNTEARRRERTITLLEGVTGDDAGTLDRLVPVVYEELKRIARRQLGREAPGHTLQTTALVHEAYVRLAEDPRVTDRGRAYFFGAAARAIRQVLVDHARRRSAARRGGDARRVTLDEAASPIDAFAEELLALDEALTALAARSPRQARVVECRYFAGLTVEETADTLDISPRTVKYDWAAARAWLYERLGPTADAGGEPPPHV